MIVYKCPACGAIKMGNPPYTTGQRCDAKLNGKTCRTRMKVVSIDGRVVANKQRALDVCRSECLSVYLTEDEKRKVKQVAKNKRITMSELIVNLLKEAKYI